MILQFTDSVFQPAFTLPQLFKKTFREWLTAVIIAICVILLRSLGFLQVWELSALDQFFRLRPHETPTDRITIVSIDESSLKLAGSWPISDLEMAEVINKLKRYNPNAIGLDIYRDLPVQPGYEKIIQTYKSMPNLIGIELLNNDPKNQILAPPELQSSKQVGFNNLLYDIDGKVRRSLLYLHINNQEYQSFPLKVALLYLKSRGVTPKKATYNPEYLQLGKAIFTRLESNYGAYIDVDDRGYQILVNFPNPSCQNTEKYQKYCAYDYVSLQDILNNNIPENLIRDRIILIGSTAPSLQDFLFIPYSSGFMGMNKSKPIAGVELQAYFIDELISASIEGRPLIKVWSDILENIWIFIWSFLGVFSIFYIKKLWKIILVLLISSLGLFISVYVAFLGGWWIPVIPAYLAFFGSAIGVIFQLAYIQRELKRSKEFLYEVINAIPDPIFVKNTQHQWIMLNDAYCRFTGYSYSVLMEKSDYDIFPKHEADIFREQDNLVFKTHQPKENEEEFTDAHGNTYSIATKRSLHRDAAGNLFLVGVIRDITERKQAEQKLKRQADDLSRSNFELKMKEINLRQLAYYDSLTGLPNRKFFHEQFCEFISQAKSNNSLLGLLFIDLDGFKKVNDTLGHDIGDRLLIIVAQRLNNTLRSTDIVSRLGGDEFTIILGNISHEKFAASIAEKLLKVITEPIVLDGNLTQVSASIGISIYPLNGQDCETLIKEADTAMYQAKHLGKNRYEFAISDP
ncbi:MAG: CHASE2 domain-containing protein [Nostocales cyanobacterium]|nr:MAG: CHASE2 domain-containing protein [Nostocales cyanobacterium]TAF16321.1 MAG: CHASE2 domain-containing protein [Nostocales cyanobacterium]